MNFAGAAVAVLVVSCQLSVVSSEREIGAPGTGIRNPNPSPSQTSSLKPKAYSLPQASSPHTRAERTDYLETSRYADVVEFLETVAASSSRIHLTHFGYTYEGRSLPLAVFGDVKDATAQSVKASGKTRVFVMGNIHAGEVCGKEALLMLLRDLAQNKHSDWASSMTVLAAPIYNADGNERVRLDNRRGQNGPVAGMGQRPNAQGLDLNRDHIKLESPEARSLVRLLNEYDPHLVIDLHTTNGTRHAYHLTYAAPLHPNTHPAIIDLLRGQLLPEVTRRIRQRTGWEFYYYGNVPRGGRAERGWYTYDHRPRFNSNYVGLRNRLGILSEAYSYASFRERVLASLHFVEEILGWTHRNGSALQEAVRLADAQAWSGQSLGLRAQLKRSAQPVEILMGEVERGSNPYSGRPLLKRLDVRRPESMPEFGAFQATVSQAVPAAYLIPDQLNAVLDLLRAHGIQLRQLDREQTLDVERFRLESSSQAEREFQGHRERTLAGSYQKSRQTVPAGSWIASTSQPLGRLLFTLLEPLSDDGLVNWNLFDAALEGQQIFPVWRTFSPIQP